MNKDRRSFCCVLVLSCILAGYAGLAFGEASGSEDSAVTVQRIMTAALSRCYSTASGIKKISFASPTNQEFTEMKALGMEAVVPLAAYLDLEPKDGLTQLLAVKFLMAIGGPPTLGPLRRAFAEDQWEVTRAAALSGMSSVSQLEAKPYVEAALKDQSQLVRRRAQQLWDLMSAANK
jgi:hypothetical protein